MLQITLLSCVQNEIQFQTGLFLVILDSNREHHLTLLLQVPADLFS